MTNRDWQVGTLLESHTVAENVTSLTFNLPDFDTYKAGQHCDIRLTAPNGYQAERSYSIASSPESKTHIEFGVQLLTDGEVSPYLTNLAPGGQIEIRGPIGGHFTWDVSLNGPLILIGGGSGMVPLMSMLRHHMQHLDADIERDIVFVISARKLEYVLYYDELRSFAAKDPHIRLVITITDSQPEGWTGYSRRVDGSMLRETIGSLAPQSPAVFICGPTAFVEAVASTMITIGFDTGNIKTERFG